MTRPKSTPPAGPSSSSQASATLLHGSDYIGFTVQLFCSFVILSLSQLFVHCAPGWAQACVLPGGEWVQLCFLASAVHQHLAVRFALGASDTDHQISVGYRMMNVVDCMNATLYTCRRMSANNACAGQ